MFENSMRINSRRHPGIRGPRPDLRVSRLAVMKESAEAWAKLSAEEKAARNPKQAEKYLRKIKKT